MTGSVESFSQQERYPDSRLRRERCGRALSGVGARVGFPAAVQAAGKHAGGLNVGINDATGAGGWY
jgi:hypothetical protein